jgi:hypothetical protein
MPELAYCRRACAPFIDFAVSYMTKELGSNA